MELICCKNCVYFTDFENDITCCLYFGETTSSIGSCEHFRSKNEVDESKTDYICPQCKDPIHKEDIGVSSEQKGLHKYICKSCGFVVRLYEKDAENMYKKGVW